MNYQLMRFYVAMFCVIVKNKLYNSKKFPILRNK